MSELLRTALASISYGWQVALVDMRGRRLGAEEEWLADESSLMSCWEQLGKRAFGCGVRAGAGVLVIASAGTLEALASQDMLLQRGTLTETPHVVVDQKGGGPCYWLYPNAREYPAIELAPGIRTVRDELVLLPPTALTTCDYRWRRSVTIEACGAGKAPSALQLLFDDRSTRETNRKEVGQKVVAALSAEGAGGDGPPSPPAEPAPSAPGGNGRVPPGWDGDIVDGRPAIEIVPNEEQMGLRALRVLAMREDIYQRGGALCTIAYDRGKLSGVVRPRALPRIVDLNADRLRGIMSDELVWYSWRTRRLPSGEQVTMREIATVPKYLPSNVISRFEYPEVRVIESVVETPILRPDGTVCDTPGYDEKTGVLYAPQIDFPSIPENPTREQVAEACELLKEPFMDFPFSNQEVHLAGAIAGLLSPIARFSFRGSIPLFLIDANVKGTGKSLMTDVFSQIILGRPMPRTTPTDKDEEMRKRITTLVISAPQMVLLDNIAGSFGGPSLDAAITGMLWNDRVLGTNKDVEKPLLQVWFATGNNVQVKGDMGRRVVHIRFDSSLARPYNRGGFRHPDLLDWVNTNRATLVAAALTLLRGYFAAGRPSMGLKPWGSFEGWSSVVRNALVWAGFEDPYKTQDSAQQIDPDEQAKFDLVVGFRAVCDALGGECTISQALELVERNEQRYRNGDANVERFLRWRSALQHFFDLRTTHDLPSAKSCGKLMARHRGVAIDGLEVCLGSRIDRERMTHWRVESIASYKKRAAEPMNEDKE